MAVFMGLVPGMPYALVATLLAGGSTRSVAVPAGAVRGTLLCCVFDEDKDRTGGNLFAPGCSLELTLQALQ